MDLEVAFCFFTTIIKKLVTLQYNQLEIFPNEYKMELN